MVIQYRLPSHWIRYEGQAVLPELTAARAAMLALSHMPFQRSWADDLQKMQLKREVAGTSRIEGAEFTDRELDAAMRETPQQLETRSQKQAAAALATYEWIAALPADRPIDAALIADIHRRIVTGCDDDHCPPGQLRKADENVTFGAPRHRGVEGGDACAEAMRGLTEAARAIFHDHDPLIQALALHYHFAAMHPFLDGNGRTARALEALMLQRTGLRDTLFIAMSNYYYEHKSRYLTALSDTRAADHELTPFLKFALKGIESQCLSLFEEIRGNLKKALFRNTVTELFGRLKSARKRVMSGRHVQLLNAILSKEEILLDDLALTTQHLFRLKNPVLALHRDLVYLLHLGAIVLRRDTDDRLVLSANLDWPTQITETAFFRMAKNSPKGKVHGFLSG